MGAGKVVGGILALIAGIFVLITLNIGGIVKWTQQEL